MNIFKTYSILFLLLIIPNVGFSQLYDGTIATDTFIKLIIKNAPDESSIALDQNSINVSSKLSIAVHVINDSTGKSNVTEDQVVSAVQVANSFFQNIGIKFSVDSFENVNDYNYSDISRNNVTNELLVTHSEKNRINLYLVNSINMNNKLCFGFTFFPTAPDSNYIFLTKNNLSGTNLTMELGHFFGLLTTHENKGGKEFVNEKNCATSGDFICDTYADPGLSNQVDKNCNYKGAMLDGNGTYYVPSVANIMSDSQEQCKCILTPMQYRRMLYYYKKFRQYLM